MFSYIKNRGFSYYLIGNILFQLSFIGSELVILKLLGAELVGLWQWMLLLFTYSQISRLGVINSFNREYPQSIHLQKKNRIEKVLIVTKSHVFLSSIFQSIFFLILAVYFLENGQVSNNSLVALTMSIYVIFESVINFSEAVLRGKGKFELIGKIKLIGIVVILFSLFLPQIYAFEGMLVRVILVQLLIVMLHYINNFELRILPFYFKKHVWLSLIRDGWKIWLWSYSKSFAISLPKLYILNVLGIISLGMFTPINWVLLSFSLITNSLSSFLHPILAKKVLQNKNGVNWLTYKFYITLVAMLVPIIASGIFIIPFIIDALLPQYIEIVTAMQIALISGGLDVMMLVASTWVVSKDYLRMYLFLAGTLLIKVVCFAILYFNFSHELINVAICMVLSSLLMAFWVSILALQQKIESDKNIC